VAKESSAAARKKAFERSVEICERVPRRSAAAETAEAHATRDEMGALGGGAK